MGKGDKRRPTHVDDETFEERWWRTFGCNKTRTNKDKCPQSNTEGEKCVGNMTPGPDINPDAWEEKDE